MENLKQMTEEIFNKFESDDKFIHNVAFPVICGNSSGEEEYKKAMTTYTQAKEEFIVNNDLINKGKKIYQERKNNILKSITTNKLVFVGMGMDFNPSSKEHIGNHRIRTYFKNNEGIMCFVEFGTGRNKDFLRCDHALMNTKKSPDEWKSLREQDTTEKRLPKLETINGDYIPYTKNNILELVNKCFNCNFKELDVYSYFINTNDYFCISEVTK